MKYFKAFSAAMLLMLSGAAFAQADENPGHFFPKSIFAEIEYKCSGHGWGNQCNGAKIAYQECEASYPEGFSRCDTSSGTIVEINRFNSVKSFKSCFKCKEAFVKVLWAHPVGGIIDPADASPESFFLGCKLSSGHTVIPKYGTLVIKERPGKFPRFICTTKA